MSSQSTIRTTTSQLKPLKTKNLKKYSFGEYPGLGLGQAQKRGGLNR
jgi:hypothetical protein